MNYLVSSETLECSGGSEAMQDAPNLRAASSSSQQQGFLLETGGLLLCHSGTTCWMLCWYASTDLGEQRPENLW